MKKNDIGLTPEEIQILKSARKIFKKLQKKAVAWQTKIDKMPFETYEAATEEFEFDNWLESLYRKTSIDFYNDCTEPFFDLDMKVK